MPTANTNTAGEQGFPEEYRQARESALQSLEDGEPGAALSAFTRWYRYPVDLEETDLFVDASSVFAQLAEASGNRRVADALTIAADSPTDGDSLFRLGAELFEVEGYPQAAAVLQRGLALNPRDVRIASELVLCLEAVGLNGNAVEVCESLEVELPPLLSALYLFNLTLSGRWDRARQLLGDLEGLISAANASMGSVDEDADKEMVTARHIVDEVRPMLDRADAINDSLGSGRWDELWPWEMVFNGTFLLEQARENNGRYAVLFDSYQRCRNAIYNLERLFEAVDFEPQRVVSLPQRSSRILATAAATLLGLSHDTWSPDDNQPGLVVAYDLTSGADAEGFANVALLQARGALDFSKSGQALWIHWLNWTRDTPVSPEILTLLAQKVVPPWGGPRFVLTEDDEVERIEEDQSPVENLARMITELAPSPDVEETTQACISLARAVDSLPYDSMPGLLRATHEFRRNRHRAGGPIRSGHFL